MNAVPAAAETPTIRLGQLEIRYLQQASAQQSIGCFEMRVPPGSNVPPPHSHAHSEELIYVLEGKGYSVVDGERHDWEAGDLLLLPIKPGGVEHQHFNTDPDTPCRWLAFIHWPTLDHLASPAEQLEDSPTWGGGR